MISQAIKVFLIILWKAYNIFWYTNKKIVSLACQQDFFPSSVSVSTTIWMHHLDSSKMNGEKPR